RSGLRGAYRSAAVAGAGSGEHPNRVAGAQFEDGRVHAGCGRSDGDGHEDGADRGQRVNWLRLCVATLVMSSLALASSPAAWEMTTFQDFVKGKFDGVSLGRDGRLSLAPRLDTLFTSEQPVIWSVAAAPDGSLYAGTGHRGRVFHIEPDGKATVVWTADHPEVFAL